MRNVIALSGTADVRLGVACPHPTIMLGVLLNAMELSLRTMKGQVYLKTRRPSRNRAHEMRPEFALLSSMTKGLGGSEILI